MSATFINRGDSIDHTPGSDLPAGAVVVQGELVGYTKVPVPANTRGALHLNGVVTVPKATGASTAITAGANVFWDAANTRATTNAASGANKRIGKTSKAAADGDATVEVIWQQ